MMLDHDLSGHAAFAVRSRPAFNSELVHPCSDTIQFLVKFRSLQILTMNVAMTLKAHPVLCLGDNSCGFPRVLVILKNMS